jgi:hypothetical protein
MTGFLTLNSDPTENLHAVTKQYVDQNINAQMIYTTDDVNEGSINLYYHTQAVWDDISLTSDNTSVLSYANGHFTYNHPTSDGILEGQTNKYYHAATMRGDISLNSDDSQILSYGSTTGQFTLVQTNISQQVVLVPQSAVVTTSAMTQVLVLSVLLPQLKALTVKLALLF